jgi:uncharacterized membrane protein YphA (DoxX/SURF4 family)
MSGETPRPWTAAERVGFRFAFVYLVLFFFPFPQGLVKPAWLGNVFESIWRPVVPWVSERFLGARLVPSDNGSGDTAYDYARVGLMVVTAALGAAVWSLADRGRRDYRVLRAWSRIWLRYALALTMLTFGVVKVVMLQFEPPGYGRLLQPLGEFSPMALLWVFMGSSPLYTSFTGITEVVGGALLLFGRTTTLGALVVAGIMANVVMLNLSYDVPVKLGALHLLLVAAVLLAPEARRLLDFFVLNRATRPSELDPVWPGRTRGFARIVKILVVGSTIVYLAWDAARSYEEQTSARERAPVPPEGWYRVESVRRDGRAIAPAPVDEFRWRTISWRRGVLGVRALDGGVHRFKSEGDPLQGLVDVVSVNDKGEPVAGPTGSLQLRLNEDGTTGVVTGKLNGHAVEATVRRQNPGDFPLTSRGFRWISEEPFFR